MTTPRRTIACRAKLRPLVFSMSYLSLDMFFNIAQSVFNKPIKLSQEVLRGVYIDAGVVDPHPIYKDSR